MAAKSMVPVILPDPPQAPAKMGLIAGGGRLPMLVAQGMRQMGHSVHAVGLGSMYPQDLPELCADFKEMGALKVTRWAGVLRKFGVTHAVMVGRVDKAEMMHSWRALMKNAPDFGTAWHWFGLKDRRSHLLLAAIADLLASQGVHLVDSTAHISDHMAELGVMTRTQPSGRQRSDIEVGWPVLTDLLKLDVGQAIGMREGDVIAVEAVEGTDRMIKRAGELCRGKAWTLLKGARAGHDRRSDVPTVGPDTIRNLSESGGKCLAVSAGDTIILDKPDTLKLADELGIAVVGMSAA